MARYSVCLHWCVEESGSLECEVEAESEQDAKRIAESYGAIELEIDFHDVQIRATRATLVETEEAAK